LGWKATVEKFGSGRIGFRINECRMIKRVGILVVRVTRKIGLTELMFFVNHCIGRKQAKD